jgi:MarR family transcriptional regulator, organic hydroperoxide resistance regulator
MERTATTGNLGFLLAKASQRWNELLGQAFRERGHGRVRPSYGSLLLPLWEEDGLRMGELARRARLSKQTLTTMVRLMERDGLVRREPDPDDGRASRVRLTARAKRLKPVADEVVGALTARVEERLSPRQAREIERGLRAIAALQ